jgi:PAS domain S-box-containing protein
LVSCALLAAAVLAADLLAPQAVSVPIAYVAVVVAGSWLPGRRYVAALAAACGLLVWVGLLHAPAEGATWPDLANRALATTAVWITAVLIVERKRGEEALLSRARRQAAVAELGQSALASKDLGSLLAAAARLLADGLGVEYAKVLQLEPDGRSLRLAAGVGWREGLVGEAVVPADRGSQAGYTLLCGEPVIVEDLRSESRFRGPHLLTDHGVASGMSAVIRGAEKPFGVLGAHTRRRRRFTQDDVHFLQSMANVLADAVLRQRAEEALRGWRDELTRRVTERSKALAGSEERFEALLEAAPDAVVIADGDGRIELVNRQTETMFGYRRDELLGRHVEVLMAERHRTEHGERIRDYSLDAKTREMGLSEELFGRRKDGSDFPVDIALNPVRTGEGLKIIASVRDISGWKRAQDALRESERLFHTLTEVAPVAICHPDAHGRCVYVSQPCSDLTGQAADEAL